MKNIALLVVLIAAGLLYVAWLNAGCELTGVMTWHGKVCAENL